jgi:hypothetical protein
MSHAPEPIDVRVVIDRVLVRVGDSSPRAAAERPRPARSQGTDHRIVVGELCIDVDVDVERAMDAFEARRLGDRVAQALGESLAALQARRADAILAGRTQGAPVLIGALRVHLRGDEADRPQPGAIAARLTGAVERRIPS